MAKRVTDAKYSNSKKNQKPSKIGLASAGTLLVLVLIIGLMEWLGIPLPNFGSLLGSQKPQQSQTQAPLPEAAPEGTLAVHFLDVGQGDCALVQCGGKNLLIDAGEAGNQETILSYLDSLSVNRLDLVIASHPHSDHIGSMAQVLNGIDSVGTVLMPHLAEDMIPTTRTYERLLTAVEERAEDAVIVSPKETYRLGDAVIRILGPVEEHNDLNDCSIVCMVEFGGISFLFTGDAETPSEADILQLGVDLNATVLKLGHHGSDTSTSQEFLDAADPTYGVISCGEGNKYGHPNTSTLEKLQEAGCTVYRTDHHGTVLFTVEDGTLTVTTEK